MKHTTLALIISLVLFAAPSQAQDPPPEHSEKHGNSSFTTETARIEDVLQVEDDGYRSVTYVVSWKGKRVGVEDPLSGSNHIVGDTITIMVSRWHPADKPDPKSLRFTLLEPHRPNTQTH